jgi:hypothetical protein
MPQQAALQWPAPEAKIDVQRYLTAGFLSFAAF